MRGIAFYNQDFFTIKQGKALYAEAIERLLMTNPGERVGQPFFGMGLKDLLFELADENTADQARERLRDQVSLYLPMVDLTTINIVIEENSFYLNVGFIEKGDLPSDERMLTLEFSGAGA